MSFDIIIIKPTDKSVTDISSVENVAPLGTRSIVESAFNHVFPGCIEGVFISGERFAVELSLSGEPIEAAHLSLRFGSSWSENVEREFQDLLYSVCQSLGGVAFAVSDNSRMAP